MPWTEEERAGWLQRFWANHAKAHAQILAYTPDTRTEEEKAEAAKVVALSRIQQRRDDSARLRALAQNHSLSDAWKLWFREQQCLYNLDEGDLDNPFWFEGIDLGDVYSDEQQTAEALTKALGLGGE